jgi:hypothetical protein
MDDCVSQALGVSTEDYIKFSELCTLDELAKIVDDAFDQKDMTESISIYKKYMENE